MEESKNKTNTRSNTIGTAKTVSKEQEGLQHSTQGESYKLPITDVSVERRNFAGPKEYHFVTKEDFFKEGDGPGTTDTDAKNDPKHSSNRAGYTKIYGGKGYRSNTAY